MHATYPADGRDAPSGVYAAIRVIVRDALGKRVGDTLAKNTDVREALGVGVGTVQRALDLLAERDALHTVSRGHLGRRIDAVDIGQCWQAAGLEPVRILLSSPGSVEMNSLESVLGDELAALGVPATVQHLPGGSRRLRQLRSGRTDLTVVSAGTYDALTAAGEAGESVHRRLEPGTYYAPERLLALDRAAVSQPAQVVAIDPESFDHEALTLAQFPPAPGRRYLHVHYPEVPSFVLAGVVDAGIWHVTSTVLPLNLAGLRSRTMSGSAIETRDRLSGAVLSVWRGRSELAAVLRALRLDGLGPAIESAIADESAAAARLEAARRAVEGDEPSDGRSLRGGER